MGTFISPIHYIPDGVDIGPPETWDIEFQIDVFAARTDGWHLEIADRCINGWKNKDGTHAINTSHHEGEIHYIPDLAWAVLQIVLYYFEVVGYFKFFRHLTQKEKRSSGRLFARGVKDILPKLKDWEIDILWTDLRNALYHKGINKSRVHLRVQDEPVSYDENRQIMMVNPHILIQILRKDLQDYVTTLKKPKQIELRESFREAFISNKRPS